MIAPTTAADPSRTEAGAPVLRVQRLSLAKEDSSGRSGRGLDGGPRREVVVLPGVSGHGRGSCCTRCRAKDSAAASIWERPTCRRCTGRAAQAGPAFRARGATRSACGSHARLAHNLLLTRRRPCRSHWADQRQDHGRRSADIIRRSIQGRWAPLGGPVSCPGATCRSSIVGREIDANTRADRFVAATWGVDPSARPRFARSKILELRDQGLRGAAWSSE